MTLEQAKAVAAEEAEAEVEKQWESKEGKAPAFAGITK